MRRVMHEERPVGVKAMVAVLAPPFFFVLPSRRDCKLKGNRLGGKIEKKNITTARILFASLRGGFSFFLSRWNMA